MMRNDFVHSVAILATELDGDRDRSELHIDEVERHLMQLTKAERDEIRRHMVLIVAGLSRLEVRMIATDGPLNRKF